MVKFKTNLAYSSKEGHGSKRAVLPMMMMMIYIYITIINNLHCKYFIFFKEFLLYSMSSIEAYI
jgi:hypothetical protein